MRILVEISTNDLAVAEAYLRHHGRKPTKKAILDLLRSAAVEGIFDLQTTVENLIEACPIDPL